MWQCGIAFLAIAAAGANLYSSQSFATFSVSLFAALIDDLYSFTFVSVGKTER